MIFISRRLRPASPLRAWAEQHGLAVQDRSLLRFSAVPFTPPEEADWWFFYSPRAVRYAADQLPDLVRTAAIGPGTGEWVRQVAGRLDFSGDGHPARTAAAFVSVAAGQRVFFPRARHSRRSVQRILKDRLTVLDAICYDNHPAPPAAPIPATTFIFTSPLNVAAYLDAWPLPPQARIIALGATTAAALRQRGITHEQSRHPTEAALIELLGGG